MESVKLEKTLFDDEVEIKSITRCPINPERTVDHVKTEKRSVMNTKKELPPCSSQANSSSGPTT